MDAKKVSISESVQVLTKKKREAISCGANAGYPEMIAEVLRHWGKMEKNTSAAFDPKKQIDLGEWYEQFDNLSFFVGSDDF